MKKFGSLAALVLLLAACRNIMEQSNSQEQHNGTDGGTPTTAFVDSVRISIPTKICIGVNIQLNATVHPFSSDQSGTWSGGNGNASITPTGMLSPSKAGTVPVSFRQTVTGTTDSKTLTIVDCSTSTPTTGGIITPVGAQTMVMGQSETYFGKTPSAPNDAVSNAKIVWSVSPGACITTSAMGLASVTNYSQVKVTAVSVGTGKLRATVGNVTDSIPFTCISNSGTVGNQYITIDEVTSWTAVVGDTKQFKATCHNFLPGTECKPYWFAVNTGIVAMNGEDKTLTNDPIFGTGTFLAGFAKARGKGSTQIYVYASKFNNAIYNKIDAVVN